MINVSTSGIINVKLDLFENTLKFSIESTKLLEFENEIYLDF